MNLLAISLRNLRIRALSTFLTIISITIGTMLLAALLQFVSQTEKQYTNSAIGYGTIVGAKSASSLDLVMSTVYNVGAPAKRVPFKVYRELHESKGRLDGYNRQVVFNYVIPQARGGDTYKDFPIVGTTDEMFRKFYFEIDDATREPIPLPLNRGRLFDYPHEKFVEFADTYAERKAAGHFTHNHAPGEPCPPGEHAHGNHYHGDTIHFSAENEAVVGFEVARKLGLRLGDHIEPVHEAEGIDPHVHLEAICQVVGVLERTGTPIDRVIYIPISTFLTMAGHEPVHASDEISGDNIQLTSIICRGRRSTDDMNTRYAFEGRRDAQGVWTLQVVREFLSRVGTATDVLRLISWLVLAVAAISILVALYNTMNERRREIAIMRSLGATRGQIAAIVLGEAAVISTVGAVLGVLLCHAGIALAVDFVADQSGVLLDWTAFSIQEVWLILAAIALGCFAGFLPAAKGSRTEVADNLGPVS